MVKQFWASFKEARQGRKDEAQRIAAERDQWKLKAESYYNRKQRLKDVLWQTRRVAMQKGNLAPEDLPDVPDDDH
jgi:cell shape-determining protein MreC